MRVELVSDALKNAAATTLITHGAIWHSDHGGQYTSAAFRAQVKALGMRSSMGRTGVCWDNAAAESFFLALKNERVYRTVYTTKVQAKRDVISYIEGFYNNPLPPFCFELSQAKRSPLQLPTSTPSSIRKTIKTTVRNLRSSPDHPTAIPCVSGRDDNLQTKIRRASRFIHYAKCLQRT